MSTPVSLEDLAKLIEALSRKTDDLREDQEALSRRVEGTSVETRDYLNSQLTATEARWSALLDARITTRSREHHSPTPTTRTHEQRREILQGKRAAGSRMNPPVQPTTAHVSTDWTPPSPATLFRTGRHVQGSSEEDDFGRGEGVSYHGRTNFNVDEDHEEPGTSNHRPRPEWHPSRPRPGEQSEDERTERRPRRPRERNEVDDDLSSIKVQIPPFYGSNNPDDFLDWKTKCETIFSSYTYSERKKVQLAIIDFKDYAHVWWTSKAARWRSEGIPIPTSWEALMDVMTARFVPENYHDELLRKLHSIYQGNRSVDEYYKEMELLLIRTGLDMDDKHTLYRFLNGLKREIKEHVEMYSYASINELRELCVKAENHLRGRSKPYNKPGEKSVEKDWQPKPWDKHGPKGNGNASASTGGPRQPTNTNQPPKSNPPTFNESKKETTCFKCQRKGHYARDCPNQRAAVLRNDQWVWLDEIETDESSDERESDCRKESEVIEEPYVPPPQIEYNFNMVAMRSLSSLPQVDEDNTTQTSRIRQQRENLFYCAIHVGQNTALAIVDNGSCTNVVSQYAVNRLGLQTIPHPQPYKLHWMSNDGAISVTEQALIQFNLNGSNERILCDVTPMDACHILLGRPWLSDRNVSYDGGINRLKFQGSEGQVVVYALSPLQVQKACETLEREKEKFERDLKPGPVHAKTGPPPT